MLNETETFQRGVTVKDNCPKNVRGFNTSIYPTTAPLTKGAEEPKSNTLHCWKTIWSQNSPGGSSIRDFYVHSGAVQVCEAPGGEKGFMPP